MAGPNDSAKWHRVGLWAALAFGAVAFLSRVAEGTRDVVALLAMATIAALVVALVFWSRRRSQRQIEAGKRSGRLSVKLNLDLSCLPGDWPTMARETLSPMLTSGPHRFAFLPVRVTANDGYLEIDKRRNLLLGHAPFHAQVSTAVITGITAGPPFASITGSSITIALRGGEELRGDVPVGAESAEDLAGQLRALMGAGSGLAASRGIRVTSPPPPKRMSPRRAWLLMMATLPPAAIAIVPQDKTVSYAATWMAVLYAFWLTIQRPVSMARRLAIALVIAAIGFVIDAIGFASYATTTDQLVRVAGSLVAAGTAGWMMRSSRSNKGSEHGSPAA